MLDLGHSYLFKCSIALIRPLLTDCLGCYDEAKPSLGLSQLDHHHGEICLTQSHLITAKENLELRLLAEPMTLRCAFLLPRVWCKTQTNDIDGCHVI